MKKGIVIVIVFFLTLNVVWSQDSLRPVVKVIADASFDSLIAKHQELSKRLLDQENHDGIDGYRIQIFFDSGNNSKQKATEVLEEFMEDYPQVKAYITFREPYYRVRVGDFRSRLEAAGFLDRIDRKYPNAWIIKDKISFPELETKNEGL